MLRAGTLIFHALARRLRDLDLEVFFFGTATVWQYYTLQAAPPPQVAALGLLRGPAIRSTGRHGSGWATSFGLLRSGEDLSLATHMERSVAAHRMVARQAFGGPCCRLRQRLPIAAFAGRVLARTQYVERRPAGVDFHILAAALFAVEVGPTPRADATAVRTAKG
jgi:hypothetical protein